MEISGEKVKKSYYHMVDSRYPLCPYTLPEIYERAAKREDGGSVTWHDPYEHMTHKQMYDKAMLFAKSLMALGLKRGDLFSCLGTEGSDGLIMFMACSSIGIMFNAPYMYDAEADVKRVLEELKPAAIMIGTARADLDNKRVCATAVKVLAKSKGDINAHQVKYAVFDSLTSSEFLDAEDNNNQMSSSVHTMKEFLEAGHIIRDEELTRLKSLVGPNEPCFIACSSGSTGKSKSIITGAATYTNAGIRKMHKYGATKNTKFGVLNLSTIDIACLEDFAGTLYLCSDLLVLPYPDGTGKEPNSRMFMQAMQDHRPEFCHVDMYFLPFIVNNPKVRNEYDLSSVKSFLIAGAPSSVAYKKKLCAAFPKSIDCYGLSEYFHIAGSEPGTLTDKPRSCGKPYVNSEIKIVDEEGRCVPLNTLGEILVRGYMTFLRYEGNPELTASMFDKDGWMKTGDTGIMDNDGDLEIIGRMAYTERLKVAGDCIYTSPIELTISQDERIRECAIVGVPLADGNGHQVTYCVVPKIPDTITINDVRDIAVDKLDSPLHHPWRVIFLDKIPRIRQRAKVAKRELLAQVLKMIEADNEIGKVAYNGTGENYSENEVWQ